MSSSDGLPTSTTIALDAAVTVAMVSDSLDALGARRQVLAQGLSPLVEGVRFAGRARTVRFAPVDEDSDAPYDEAIALIDGISPGDVVVAATGGSMRSAYWGELFSAAALGRGAAGLVCDGPVRDTAQIRRLGLPVVALGARPVDFRARMRIVEVQRPVECAQVLVRPGDLVVGDDDGVVVVPQHLEEVAVKAANARAAAESTILAELLAGASMRRVWEEHGVL